MAVTKIKGVSSLGGGKYEELVIDGVVTANGDLEVESLDVDGVVNINGKVDSKSFVKVDGVVTLNDKLRAKTVDVDGVVTIHGNVEADEVKIDGVVNAKGQVSADLVESHGVFSAEEVVGDKVIIHCEKRNKHIHNLFGFGRKERKDLPKIGTIEATEIDVDGIRADNLNGQNIVIGPECVVENVDCTGRLAIAPDAVVKNINGQEYKR